MIYEGLFEKLHFNSCRFGGHVLMDRELLVMFTNLDIDEDHPYVEATGNKGPISGSLIFKQISLSKKQAQGEDENVDFEHPEDGSGAKEFLLSGQDEDGKDVQWTVRAEDFSLEVE